MFRVKVEEGPAELIGKTILCTLNGNMRRFRIRVLPGDPVLAEMSLYDLGKARITRRLREEDNQTIAAAPEVAAESPSVETAGDEEIEESPSAKATGDAQETEIKDDQQVKA